MRGEYHITSENWKDVDWDVRQVKGTQKQRVDSGGCSLGL